MLCARLTNARFLTMDPDHPVAHDLGIWRGPLVGSSDRPVTDGSPLRAVRFMVERASGSGQVIGPDEGITVDEALRAYTVAGAVACRWEDTLGSLTPGKRADLVVLGDDPRRVDTSRIGDIEVVAAYVDGEEAGRPAA